MQLVRNREEDLKNPCIKNDIERIKRCYGHNIGDHINGDVYDIWVKVSDYEQIYWVPTYNLDDQEIVKAFDGQVWWIQHENRT